MIILVINIFMLMTPDLQKSGAINIYKIMDVITSPCLNLR